jgi:hypothetical protein
MTKEDRESFIILKTDVEHIKTDVQETKTTVNKFYSSMTRIEQKLFNDDSTGEKGIVFQVGENTLKLKSVYLKIAVAIGISNGIGIVLGAFFL